MPNPPVHIVGCGGIGSWAALALAKMGISKLRLWDDDVVEEENIGCQVYGNSDIGEPKVNALGFTLLDQVAQDKLDVRSMKQRVDTSSELGGIVIAAVDSMKSRQTIFENCRNNQQVSLLIDGRIGGELIRLYTLNPHNQRHQVYWDTMWHSDENSSTLPCTGQQVVYVGFAIGSLIAKAVALYLREKMISKEIIYNVGGSVIVWKEDDESTSQDSQPNGA